MKITIEIEDTEAIHLAVMYKEMVKQPSMVSRSVDMMHIIESIQTRLLGLNKNRRAELVRRGYPFVTAPVQLIHKGYIEPREISTHQTWYHDCGEPINVLEIKYAKDGPVSRKFISDSSVERHSATHCPKCGYSIAQSDFAHGALTREKPTELSLLRADGYGDGEERPQDKHPNAEDIKLDGHDVRGYQGNEFGH